jgi:hypothetical protein
MTPGHQQCWEINDPIFDETSDYIRYKPEVDKNHWWEAYQSQYLWKEAFANSEILKDRGFVLDLSPLILRPDAHFIGTKQDCLHWLLPGAIDTASHFLWQALAELEGWI